MQMKYSTIIQNIDVGWNFIFRKIIENFSEFSCKLQWDSLNLVIECKIKLKLQKKRIMDKKFFAVFGLACIFFLTGCVQQNSPRPAETVQKTPSKQLEFPAPPPEKELIAIAGFQNKSTYSADKLWDTCSQLLASHLLEAGYFKVVEWEKMKQLFDWEALSTCSLATTPEGRSKAKKILLCEYFINGAVTQFNVSQKADVSAFSKKKTIETTIRVDLFLQDSQTGEYMGFGKGEGFVSQVYEGGMSGGQLGTWDPEAADNALKVAIKEALIKLINNYEKRNTAS